MDKNDLIKELRNLISSDKKNITMSLVSKINKEDAKYFFHTATLENDIKNSIGDTLVNGFSNSISNFELKEYDPVYPHEDTIDFLSTLDIPNYDLFKCDLAGTNNKNTNPKEIDISKINFYCFTIKDLNTQKEALFFKSYRNPKMLRKYVPLKLVDNTLRKIEDIIFYLDSFSDVLIFNDIAYICNRNTFNSIFDFKDEFLKTLEIALDTIYDKDIIDNFDQFREDCKQSMKVARAFTRIYRKRKENFQIVIDNFDQVPEKIESLNQDIEFSDSNKIIYKSKKDLDVISTIFSDGFARTFICGRNIIAGEDEEIPK